VVYTRRCTRAPDVQTRIAHARLGPSLGLDVSGTVNSPDEPTTRTQAVRRAPKPASVRYLVAVAAAAGGVLVTLALFASDITEQPVYGPLLAAVAIASWYGGFGPSALVVVVGWTAALGLLASPSEDMAVSSSDDLTRWSINLAVAFVIAGIGGLIRHREERSAVDAETARTAVREIESLQQLSIALTGAVSSADVAHCVSSHSRAILDASGVALGLVDGQDLVVVDPGGLAAQARPDGSRVELTDTTLLTQAVRTGALAIAHDRAELRASFADSAAVLPRRVERALAVPLHAEGAVIGSVGFVFESDRPFDDDTQALARIVADLAGQALERARLYESERESRQALDRILRVAPRFLVDDTEEVVGAICREARTTFGADYGVLWRVRDEDIELLGIDPPHAELASRRLPLADFPQLREALGGLGSSFVPDAAETTLNEGLRFVRELGIRSSLRTPVVIAGSIELVLSISWHSVISEPDWGTIAVVRRFADQAGLALEQVERRRAEAEIASRADARRQLQEVTAALSLSATTLDVSKTCLEHALASTGAEAGFVVVTSPAASRTVDLVANAGYDDDDLAAWRALDLDADVPFARAIASAEPVWALSADELSAFTGLTEKRSTGWLAIPLMTSRGARGALHLSFRRPRTLTGTQREWLQSMVAQCGQALERSSLYEGERRSRLRAERLQGMTTLLSNALSTSDVAQVVADEVAAAVDATAVAVASVHDGRPTGELARSGEADVLESLIAEGDSPALRAIGERRSLMFASRVELAREFPDLRLEALADGGLLVVPLVAARRANAVLVAAWNEPHRITDDDRGLVEALAGQAAQALDRASRFESEQTIAETLQRSVLPTSLPRVDGVQLAARYLPGTAELDVGGDWFDALHLPDGKLGLVVGDVVGKGVQAAATMAQLRNATRAFSVERLKPASVLHRLNRLADEVLETSFATLAYLWLDPESRVCRLASAGHPPPVVASPDGRVELLEGVRGLPLGTGIRSRYRQETRELPAGSVVLLYTDGLVERRGRSIDEGLDALRTAVADAPKDPDRLLEHVLEHVVGPGERGDDIALLAARVLPVAPQPLELQLAIRFASLDVVRDALRAWLEGVVDLDRSEAEDLVLATWEACANAIEHTVEPRADTVAVTASLEDGRILVTVADSGRWAPPSERKHRGLGLTLIGALVTSVDVEESEEGTTVKLEKALTGASAHTG
jgi:serine phosphatase RsbU (regulator of sigma subunit)/anti-sigma regulatory factor (Ser/Thr protein kinase)